MLDWEGNMVEKRHRSQIMLSDVPEDVALAASAVHVSSIETTAIDAILQRSDDASGEAPQRSWKCIPHDADQVSSMLAGVSPIMMLRRYFFFKKYLGGGCEVGYDAAAILFFAKSIWAAAKSVMMSR
jgi:hypothetical protein